mmetsp:Transcript_115418/g.200917  ORF Transcript_115418/g.200917 Transcript_115418/m.200917 type:complete len:86 (+) Transcript_115418:308-565(+)
MTMQRTAFADNGITASGTLPGRFFAPAWEHVESYTRILNQYLFVAQSPWYVMLYVLSPPKKKSKRGSVGRPAHHGYADGTPSTLG